MDEKEFIDSQVGSMEWLKDRPFDVVQEIWMIRNAAEKKLKDNTTIQQQIGFTAVFDVCTYLLEGLGEISVKK